jgi:hypothetical protein
MPRPLSRRGHPVQSGFDRGSGNGQPASVARIQLIGRETKMKRKVTIAILGLLVVAGSVTLTVLLGSRAATVSASSGRNGQLHITKNCSLDNGNAGDYCTITSSNLAEIPSTTSLPPTTASKVFYDQAGGIPCPSGVCTGPNPTSPGMLDSNVVLYVGPGDWAIGRCTVDVDNIGVCSFSDGTGELTGFRARVKVTPFSPSPSEVNYHWDGTYSFDPQPDK